MQAAAQKVLSIRWPGLRQPFQKNHIQQAVWSLFLGMVVPKDILPISQTKSNRLSKLIEHRIYPEPISLFSQEEGNNCCLLPGSSRVG